MAESLPEYGPRDLIGYGSKPPHPAWPNDAKICVSIVLNYEEGSEVTPENGDNVTEVLASEMGPGVKPIVNGDRDVTMESMYEYGSRAGVWRVLRLAKEYGIPITSYAVGMALEKNPEVAEILEKDGHEIASHGYRWVDRSQWTVEEERENIIKAIDAIKNTSPSGRPPRGWYYGMTSSKGASRSRALLCKTFKELGLPLKWYSDAYDDDLPYWIQYPGSKKEDHEGLLIVPYTMDVNDYKNAGYQAFITADQFAEYLIDTFDELYKEGVDGAPKMFSVGLHARIIGHAGRIKGLRKFFEHAKSKPGVWFARREEIADHWTEKFPYQG